MAGPVPAAVPGITDPEQVRVLLYASGKPVHAPLVGVSRAALNVSDFALTLLDDVDAAEFYGTLGQIPNAQVRNDLSPDKAFRRGNIIGPISQIGGIPTGALTTGWITTAQGKYRRHADGKQECVMFVPVRSVAVTGGAGTLFISAQQSALYPAAFSLVDFVSAWETVGLTGQVASTGTAALWNVLAGLSITVNTQCVIYATGRWS